jgi:hypothetical protein
VSVYAVSVQYQNLSLSLFVLHNIIRTCFSLGNSRVGNNHCSNARGLADGFQVNHSDASHSDDSDPDVLLEWNLFDAHGQ